MIIVYQNKKEVLLTNETDNFGSANENGAS